ncbi:choline-sulfatase (plasmid) [Fulvitalea axinellae]|uniref:Choline-sulfatase n=1 Tax=Fulvitalea axinellae TaxID=1182444 RepID=A0AAU9CQZ2_9BACT|nr:choline-sulfatase [Fulvitalea axinellae]
MFSRKRLIRRAVGLLAWTGILTFQDIEVRAQGKKPNFLFIIADDVTYEGVQALGDLNIRTPNLDRLVREGTTFTHAYNMGAWRGGVCTASRTMLNTGMYLWKSQRHAEVIPAEEWRTYPFWSKTMSKAGYETYFTGKWHVKRINPKNLFDHVSDVRGGMPNQTKEGYFRPKHENDTSWLPWDKSKRGFWKGGQHWTEKLADTGRRYIRQAAKSEKPFFMYLAFNAAHDPRQAPKSYVDSYPVGGVKTPENFMAEYPDFETLFPDGKMRDENLAPFPRTEYSIKVNRREYYALITYMDEQLGRILDALEESGQVDNTYIVFTADHGLAVGRHGLLGKQNMYDHSLRVPFMILGPKIPKGKKIDTPMYLQDAMPTALEVAGIPKPDYVRFKSVLPVIRGERKSNLDAVYGAFMANQRCVIDDGYKLILYPGKGTVKLFDLGKDKSEMVNLAGKPKYRKRIRRLYGTLKELQKENSDTLKLDKYYPQLVSGI